MPNLVFHLFFTPFLSAGTLDEKIVTITVSKKENLANICKTWLENPHEWKSIAKFNQLKNPNLIYPGQRIKIPVKRLSRQGKDGLSAGSVHVVRDITESTRLRQQQEAMQEQLIQSQKMDAIGALAGGIAHDFNNILSAIMGYTQLAQDEIPDENKSTQHLEEAIQKAIQRQRI